MSEELEQNKIDMYVKMTMEAGVAPIELRFTQINDLIAQNPIAYRAKVVANSVLLGKLEEAQYDSAMTISPVGVKFAEWGIRETVKLISRMEKANRDFDFISITCPPSVLVREDIYTFLQNVLQEENIEHPKKLCLEFPNTLLLENQKKVQRTLLDLKLLGIILISETSNVKLVGAYATSDSFAYENSFYQTLSILIVFFAVVMLVFVCFYIIKFIRSIILSRTELWKVKYNCYTYDGFLEKASSIAKSLKGSKFVVVATEIRFYKLLLEKGENYHVPFNKAISNIIAKDINNRYETYGYGTSSRFYMLLHYTNQKDLEKRLENINQKCAKHKIENERKLQIMFGACELNDQHDVVAAAVNAQEALAQTVEYIGIRDFTMYVYDEDDEKLDKDFIEMNAEKSLAKDEFKVFFQPKYNVAKNAVDGAEALMRWYIPAENRFYPPAAFLPVIETNGFISHVDIYVFEQVCKYLRKSLDQGERVYPISVNVSRFTIMQDDFVDKYSEIKKKYKIRDGLLWIEFTESGDLQDYSFIEEIITKLHAAGFKCSIDDFGTGYSSYECLKTLDLDEIKLDRFYVKDELKSDRDKTIVRSVIDLGRALNMKVTVEGVADQETFNQLKDYGCEVIQGFLYSRPLPLADYISFINSSYRGSFQ